MKSIIDIRKQILLNYGADQNSINELLEYNKSISGTSGSARKTIKPLKDEKFISHWIKYVNKVNSAGSFLILKKYLMQLNFPIEKGISRQQDYIITLNTGIINSYYRNTPGLKLIAPEQIKLSLHKTLTGRVPIIIAENRNDFLNIVSAFANNNEPLAIPDSVGSYAISGHSNLHQNFCIVLSKGYYSGIAPEQIGLTEKEWLDKSQKIRIEHESTHYAFKRLYSTLGNRIIHELIADFEGIVIAMGSYKAELFLKFLGIDNINSDAKEGGRIYYYVKELSEKSLTILIKLIRDAAMNLEKLFVMINTGMYNYSRLEFLVELCQYSLEELSADNFISRFKNL